MKFLLHIGLGLIITTAILSCSTSLVASKKSNFNTFVLDENQKKVRIGISCQEENLGQCKNQKGEMIGICGHLFQWSDGYIGNIRHNTPIGKYTVTVSNCSTNNLQTETITINIK